MKPSFLMYFAVNILALYFLTACGNEKSSLAKVKTKVEGKGSMQCGLSIPVTPTNLQIYGGVLTWSEVVGATTYNVFVGTLQSGNCKSTTLESVSTNSINVPSGSGNCAYVVAGNCAGKSGYTQAISW